MVDAVYNTLNVHITADDNPVLNGAKLGYKVTGRALVFDGFTKIYNNVPLEDKNDDDDDATEKTLPDMQEGDVMYLQDTKHEQNSPSRPSVTPTRRLSKRWKKTASDVRRRTPR